MCGIVGYAGRENATSILLDGLAHLEYRGYDSAGIALQTDSGLFVKKRAGKLANLRAALVGPPVAHAGIGHTRWATHGRPDDTNAHPHLDCTGRLGLVHNGIVENFESLRRELSAGGHGFRSETDTEVLAHLIEDEYAGDLAEAVRRALRRVDGAYALVVISADEPNVIVGASHHAPLLVGYGDESNFLASDATALLAHTRRVSYLEDGDLVVLSDQVVRFFSSDGETISRPVAHLDWSEGLASRGGYPHYMLKEIHEQPDTLAAAMVGRSAGASIELRELEHFDLNGLRRIELVGCGSAYYAACLGARWLEEWAGLPARASIASEFRYSPPPLDPTVLTIAVSQSGETADTLAAVRLAQEKGSPTLALTNIIGSTLDRLVEASVPLRAGPEIAVVATKSFTNQVLVLLLIAIDIARRRGSMPASLMADLVAELANLPELARRAISMSEPIFTVAQHLVQRRGFMFIGRGLFWPLAMEGALKLKEVTYLHAEGYAAGELKHGPISLLDETMSLVVISPRSRLNGKVISNLREGQARGAPVLAIASEGDAEIASIAEATVFIPAAGEQVSAILAAIPLQALAYELALLLERDIDQPRNLAKSVTVE